MRWPCMIAITLAATGCGSSRPAPSPAPAAQIAPPTAPILFQPALYYERNYTRQGTGSFVRRPDGEIFALTAAHFLDFDGEPLSEVRWLDVRSSEIVARMSTSCGPPGDGGKSDQQPIDLRRDYLLMPAEGVAEEVVQSLDSRIPDKNEKIWFPDKDPKAENGYRLITGKVMTASTNFHIVKLDEPIQPVSQSGSPIISQKTGKVIGIWGRVRQFGSGKVHIYLVPSQGLLEVLLREQKRPALREVVGKASERAN